jgi:hypothetical protein
MAPLRYRLIDTAGSELHVIEVVAPLGEGDLAPSPDGRLLPVVEVYDDEDGQEGGVTATLVLDDE